MRVNLFLDHKDALPDCTNLTEKGLPEPPFPHGVVESFDDLDDLVFSGQVLQLTADNIIDYLAPGKAERALAHWATRLAPGGKLSVGCADQLQVCWGLVHGHLNAAEANHLLYGGQRLPWQVKRISYNLTWLAEFLAGVGLRILRRRHKNYRALVVAERIA